MTSDTTPTTLEELGARIRELHPQLWTAAAVSTAPAAPTDAIETARLKAAVLGWFKPRRLVNDTSGRGLREGVLSALVSECDVEASARAAVWRLRRDARRGVLPVLLQRKDLLARVLRETGSEATDTDSRLLRLTLRGHPSSPARAREQDLPSLLRVAEWTEGIVPNAPSAAEIRGLLARSAIRESLGVLAGRFHGRDAELRALRQFVFVPGSGPAVTVRDQLPIMGVSGIGGVGKSALLARFVDRLLAMPEKRRPAVVLIDFDRARFSSGDPIALTFELTRQVAAWFPAIAEPLQQLRHRVRQNLLSSGFSSATSGLESVARSETEINYELHAILKRAGVGVSGGRPLVVVLDTFEVLQGARDDDAGGSGFRGVHAVAQWAQDLFSISRLVGLRLVIAGRAPIAEDPSFGPLLTEPERRLRGLDLPAAVALLRDFGLSARDAHVVAKAIGDPADGSCNPLILRLAARLVESGKVRPDSLMEESSDGKLALDEELVQGILYRRILAHIGDREADRSLAALAHPGLVLRRVTPDLIEKVLVPLTALKKERRIDARALFDRLRREIWLVQQVDADTVMHRADLRRTMLRLIAADMKDQARRIHRAAARYYRGGKDARLSKELAEAEAFYHRLMLMTAEEAGRLSAADVRRFESALHATLEDLPPHVIAVVKSILDRPLTDKEGIALPEPRRTEFVLRQGERHVRNDEPYRALKLLEATPEQHPLWELRALAITASWKAAKERRLLSAASAPEGTNRPVGIRTPGDAHERQNLASWVAFCLGDDKAAYASAAKLLYWYENQTDWSKLPARMVEVLARAVTYRTLAARSGGSSARQAQPIPWTRLDEEAFESTTLALEATRHAVLGHREASWESSLVLSGEVVPASADLIDQLASSGLPPELVRRLRLAASGLKKLPRRFSSGLVLGTIARSVPKPLVVRQPGQWRGLRDCWRLICPNPELRGPVKFALLETFPSEKELALVAEWASRVLDPVPDDLRPEVFSKTAARSGKASAELAKLVLYLDRSAALGRFIHIARRAKPDAPKLALVANAFDRWEQCLQPDAI